MRPETRREMKNFPESIKSVVFYHVESYILIIRRDSRAIKYIDNIYSGRFHPFSPIINDVFLLLLLRINNREIRNYISLETHWKKNIARTAFKFLSKSIKIFN